jgi:MoxR-like ATPase
MSDWHIFKGATGQQPWREPPLPPWRRFGAVAEAQRAEAYQPAPQEVDLVNVAIYLRRPLLITGKPGTGKSTLAHAVAHQLGLGPVLRWPITSHTTLQDGLYHYDAIGRLQDANLHSRGAHAVPVIGDYIRLGPLGTALVPRERPRVLLVDEIDKSDIDLPNDLLNVFEEGQFPIPELARIADVEQVVAVAEAQSDFTAEIHSGLVQCQAFPIVFMTSNGEREFPAPFLRRCVRLDLPEPDRDRLGRIVEAHLGNDMASRGADLVDRFVNQRSVGELATDQLLNAVFLTFHAARDDRSRDDLADLVLRRLNTAG